MSRHFDEDWAEDLQKPLKLPKIRNIDQNNTSSARKGRRVTHPAKNVAAETTERENVFHFTYKASRHEHQWITDSLSGFYEMHWINDVQRLVRGGKEANVYQCEAGPYLDQGLIAAKVYRPRRFRNLKNDHMYREGRSQLDEAGHVVIDDGMLHAMRKKTGYGMELLHQSWIGHEYKTMQILFEAGVDVPKPYACGNNAILMEYIGDDGLTAPALNGINLEREEAERIFERVIENVDIMLAHNRIHGDLSAYNILYWEGRIAIIDFPQAIHPDENKNAFWIFQRDVRRVCEYFTLQGVRSDPRTIAADLWQAHHRRIEHEVHPRDLDADKEEDRKYWFERA